MGSTGSRAGVASGNEAPCAPGLPPKSGSGSEAPAGQLCHRETPLLLAEAQTHCLLGLRVEARLCTQHGILRGVLSWATGSTGCKGLGGGRGAGVRVTPGGGCGGAGSPGGGCGGAGYPRGQVWGCGLPQGVWGCGCRLPQGAGVRVGVTPGGGYGGTGDPKGWVWGGGAGYFREGSESPEGAGVLCLRIETM